MESARIHPPLTIVEAEHFWTEGSPAYPSTPGEQPETMQQLSGDAACEVRPRVSSGPDESAGIALVPRDPGASESDSSDPGIDLPGVGVAHSYDLPLTITLGPREVVELQRLEKFEGERGPLLCKLLYSARRAAEKRMVVLDPQRVLCLECCGLTTLPSAKSIHHAGCTIGEVFQVLDDLLALGARQAAEGGVL